MVIIEFGKAGIYKITNMINNYVYIGQTRDFKRRWLQHIKTLKTNCNSNRLLQEDYNKYGVNKFRFEVLEYCDNSKLRLIKEQEYIEYYRKITNIYNLQNVDNIWNSSYQKEQIIKFNKGRTYTKETIAKMSYNNSGKNNPMYQKCKYSKQFIQQLRNDYIECKNYTALQKKYNIDRHIIKRLIENGTSTNPNTKIYKQKQKLKERGWK